MIDDGTAIILRHPSRPDWAAALRAARGGGGAALSTMMMLDKKLVPKNFASFM
jgi:hypothetical protein